MTMPEPLIIECEVHFSREGRGARKTLSSARKPSQPAGRVPRVARLMAVALRCEGLIRAGDIADYAELARLGRVTAARISQIMNLLLLAPDIQEALLFLPQVQRGRDPIHLALLQPIAAAYDWKTQRRLWRQLGALAAGAA
jgi:hypothetical protein